MVLSSNHLNKKLSFTWGPLHTSPLFGQGKRKEDGYSGATVVWIQANMILKFHTTACNSRSIFWKSSR